MYICFVLYNISCIHVYVYIIALFCVCVWIRGLHFSPDVVEETQMVGLSGETNEALRIVEGLDRGCGNV